MRINRLALLSALVVFLPAGAIHAQTTDTWTGNANNGLWSDASNWDPGVPGAGDNVVLNGSPQGVSYNDTGLTYGSVSVGTSDGSRTSASSLLGSSITIAETFTLNVGASTFNTNTLTIGSQFGSNGTVTLNGGTMNDDAIVGDAGVGTYNNTNGIHNVTGNLILGNQSTGNGTYTITGNAAQTTVGFASGGNGPGNPNGALIVGNAGQGNFTQGAVGQTDPGNQVTVAGDLALGVQNGSQGSYTLNTGTLGVGGALLVGMASQNSNLFTQNGGTVNIPGGASGNPDYAGVSGFAGGWVGSLVVGGDAPFSSEGSGTYQMNGGALNANSVVLGFTGNGTFNHTGGTVTTGFLDLGGCGGCNGGNSAGFYNLTGTGILISNGDENIGDFGHGEFVQNGAATTNTVSGTLALGNGQIATPNTANPGSFDRSGTYTLNAGTLTTQNTVVGTQGTGIFNQNGGTHSIANTLTVGQQTSDFSDTPGSGTPSIPVFGGPAMGTYNMAAGILVTQNATVGDAGTGTFNHTGGLVTVGSWFGGQILADGSTVPGPDEGPGVIGTLTIGAQGNNAVNIGGNSPGTTTTSSNGIYNLGLTGQTNNTAWAGYPNGPGTTPSTFDNANNAPYLQVYGNTVIGRDAGSNGTFNLAGDGSHVQINNVVGFGNQGTLVVGNTGQGTFTQTDASSVYMDGSLAIAINAGSVSNYTISAGDNLAGGSLSIGGDLEIGGTDHVGDPIAQTPGSFGGTGTFTQSSGTVTVQGNLTLGTNGDGTTGGNGTYNLSGNGALTVNNVGSFGNNGGTGTFNQTGGTAQFGTMGNSGGLQLGTTPLEGPASTGSYTITGPASLTVYGNADIGVATGTTGNMIIGTLGGTDSPTVTVNTTGGGDGNLTVGDAGTGNLTVNTGSLTVANTIQIGVNGTGTVTQTGGTVSAGFVDVAVTCCTGSGSYSISGGSLSATADLNVGSAASTGTATFQQSGSGTQVNVGGTLRVGNANGNALYTLSGGTLTTGITGGSLTNGGQIGDVLIGIGGAGELDNSGGKQISSSNQGFTLGWDSTGTYKLTGTGSLSVAANLNVGVFGAGIFQQGDGSGNTSTTVTGSLAISSGGGGPASSYTLTDGTLSVGGGEVVGFGSTGSFNQSGGSNTATGGLTIGLCGSGSSGCGSTTQFGSGTYTLGGSGALKVDGDLVLGSQTSSTGTFNYNTVAGDAATLTFTGTGRHLVVGDAGTGIFNEGSATNVTDLNLQGTGTTLVLGQSVGGNGTFNLAAGSSLEDDLIVGDAGTGTFNNGGGSHSVAGSLTLGNQSTGNGSYNLTAGGTTQVSGFTTVGAAGTGVFLNDASTHTTGNLVLGEAGGSSGTYTLQNGGALTVGTVANPGFLDVGEHGTGQFTQTSGTTTVNGDLDLGRCGGATACLGTGDTDTTTGKGTITLSGGSLSVTTFAVVGDAGTGIVNQSGSSTVTIGSELDIGRSGGVGNYNLSGGSLTVNGPTDLGGDTGAQGTITQTGGTAALKGNVNVGIANGATGTWSLSGTGAATITGNLDLGVVTGSSGTFNFNQSGGSATLAFSTPGSTMTVGDAGTGVVNQGGGDLNLTGQGITLKIGAQSGGNGQYNLTGGTLEDDLIVGDAGTGTFNNSGGTHGVTGNLVLGNQSTGNGTYNLSATGILTVSSNLEVGNVGTGTYSQTGGAATITGTMSINSLSSATISGGTLGAAGITNSGTLNLQGGTTTAPITNNATVLTTGSGVSAIVHGAAINNSSWSVTNGAALTQTGGFANNTGGSLNVSGSSASLNGGLTNSGGTVALTSGTINTTIFAQNSGSVTGTGTINVATDYTNAGFGMGNTFNNHAGVAAGVAINATGNTALSVTGSQISGSTLNLGIFHVGDAGSSTINIGNSGTTGPSLRGAVQNTNISNSQLSLNAQNYGPLNSGQSTTQNLNYNFSTTGVLTGQSFKVVTNFDNVLAQTIAVTGQVNNYASIAMANATRGILTGSGSSYALNLGNITQGSGTIQTLLNLLNNAVGPADALSMAANQFTVQDGGGYTVGIGAFSDLAAGDTEADDLSIQFDTSALGLMTETIQLGGTGSNASGWNSLFGVNDPTLTITADIVTNNGGGVGGSVPEPASLLLLLPGLAGLRAVRRRRRG